MKFLKLKPWIGAFPLKPFSEKLRALKSAEGERRFLILTNFRVSLHTILINYIWIGLIQNRVDNDLYNNLEMAKKLDRVSQGVRVTRDELPPSDPHLTHIDITSLIIFLNILMDDVTRFLKFLFKGKVRPKTKSFDQLKKTINNLQGQYFEELNKIIQDTYWYEELKDLRDKPIVHKGEKDSGIGRQGNIIGVYFRYIQGQKTRERFISNLDIDIICDNVYRFLKELNGFLCKNFDYLPLEAIKTQDDFTIARARAKPKIEDDELKKMIQELIEDVSRFMLSRKNRDPVFRSNRMRVTDSKEEKRRRWDEHTQEIMRHSSETMSEFTWRFIQRIAVIRKELAQRGIEDAEFERSFEHRVNQFGIQTIIAKLAEMSVKI